MIDISKQFTTDPNVDYGEYADAGFEKKQFTDWQLELMASDMKRIEHLRDRVGAARTGGKKVNAWRKALKAEELHVYANLVEHGVEEVRLLDGRRLVLEEVLDAAGNITTKKPIFR
jgi:hypothetical protein